MMRSNILPTPVEILREIASCLDIKNRNKSLDDKASELLIHPLQFRELIHNLIHQPVTDLSKESFANSLAKAVESIIMSYCHKMAGHGFFIGSNREHALITLNKHFFPAQVKPILDDLLAQFQRFNGPSLEALLSGVTAFDVVWRWCENQIPMWQRFNEVSKEEKDLIRGWRSGEYLPSLTSLKRLIPTEVKPGVSPLLLLARLLDALKQKSWGRRLIRRILMLITSEDSTTDLQTEVNKHTNRYFSRFGQFISTMSNLEKVLVKHHKTLDDHQKAIQLLTECKHFSQNTIPINGEGLLSWMEGRFYAQSGNLDAAIFAYGKAFDKMLYGAGNLIDTMINEALTVAAAKDNPDRVFLKKLKTAQILFGFDIPSATLSPEQKQQRFEDTVEAWEIEMWRKGFSSNFKPQMLFPGVVYSYAANWGPLLITPESEFKPDYRNPDRMRKVGDSWQRSMPQLNYFILTGNYDVTKNLIEKGASVNVFSEVGDTPLSLALQDLDLMDIPYASLDRRFYDLIATCPIKPEIVNTRTQKKRLLPLLQAVRTGKLEIVKKLIELGADVNGRGFTDEQTALNEIIKMIGLYKKPQQAKESMFKHPVTPQLLDSMRRHSAGDMGMTLTQLENQFDQSKYSRLFAHFFSCAIDLQAQRLIANTSIDELRQIATLLIESGADANAEHASPLNGYTPLMLAAELDEGDLFRQMCVSGGLPSKSVFDPNKEARQNSWQIAAYWRSKTVLALMH